MQAEAQKQDGKMGLFRGALEDPSNHSYFAREGVNPLTHAFDKKVAVHAGFGGQPLSKSKRLSTIAGLLNQPRNRSTAIYIHVPFCENHCLYCGFYNRAYKPEQSAQYTDMLLREIEIWRYYPAVQYGPIHAVYLGGGTPTLLHPDDLERLLLAIRDAFPLVNDCEITVEGRIHNFGLETMAACLSGGANRFSIGVQTFHTDLRKTMGRYAERKSVMRTLESMAAPGKAVVIVDLIYGFPGQTMAMWQRDIEDFLSLGLDGVDLYPLNLFKKSPLDKAVSKGVLPPPADLPFQAQMFAEGVNMMEKARYRRLSTSHWGKNTRERNIYNHLMKGPCACLAFGPGSGGNLQDHFYFVDTDYERWLAAVKNKRKPISMVVAPGPLVEVEKNIAVGFDLGRLDLCRINAIMNREVVPLLSPLLVQWEKVGLIRIDGSWLELTVAGQFWQVTLAQLMIDYLSLAWPTEEKK